MVKHLLIDAKNMIYRAVYVAAYDKQFKQSGHHSINIILHFLAKYRIKFNPEKFHIFWDSPRSDTWRKQIANYYKEGRGGSTKISDEDLSNSVNDLIEVCTMLFKNMGFRQYYRDNMEADDLIYAFCRMNRNDDILIISSDNDLKQITYNYSNVKMHSHLSKTKAAYEPVPRLDPVIMKCFAGDKSDNIAGYHQIGPVKAGPLTESLKRRHEFFMSEKAVVKLDGEIKHVGDKRFRENLLLIDLSLNPYLLDNIMYISKRQFQPISFSLKKIRGLIGKYKLRGVTADISWHIGPFKKLIEDSNACRNSLR